MALTPTLQDLIANLPGTMGQGIMSPAEQQAKIDQIVAATQPANIRKYGNLAQDIAEKNFGTGFGDSSRNAYQQALNTLMANEGAAQIQNQAQQSVDAAQRAAVGQAASYAAGEQNRLSQEAQNKRNISAANSRQNKAAIIGGLGNLGGGVAGMVTRDLMRPENESSHIGRMGSRIKDALGFGGNAGEGQGGNEVPSYDLGAGGKTDFGTGNLSDYSLNPTSGGTDFGTGNLSDYSFNGSYPDFQLPDFSLEGLFGSFNDLPGNFWDQEF